MAKHDSADLALIYLRAKEEVIRAGYEGEIDWQWSVRFEMIREPDFLREAAWVVLSVGFRESVIRRLFPHFSKAFFNWHSAERIIGKKRFCKQQALKVFGNSRKVDAIIQIATIVDYFGFAEIKRRISSEGIAFLQGLPFIGPVTSYHLAKNLGLEVVKPDRHLIRAARLAGCSSPEQLCRTINAVVGDPISVIDLVIWRFATIKPLSSLLEQEGHRSAASVTGARVENSFSHV